MIRMLIVGCCFGVRSERRLYEEVHLNLVFDEESMLSEYVVSENHAQHP